MSAVIVPFPRDRIFRSPELRKHIAMVYRHLRKTDEDGDTPAQTFEDALRWHYMFPRASRARGDAGGQDGGRG